MLPEIHKLPLLLNFLKVVFEDTWKMLFVIFIFTVLENRKLQAGAYILESLRHMDFGQLIQ